MRHVFSWATPRGKDTRKGTHLYSKWDMALSNEELDKFLYHRLVRVHPRFLGVVDIARLFGLYPRGLEFYDDEGNSTLQFVNAPDMIRKLFW